MIKKLLFILLAMLLLTACERQQKGTNMVMNKETAADFTTDPALSVPSKAKTPMLTGKARVLGAPFQDYTTKTAVSVVKPDQLKVTNLPNK